VVVVGGGPAGLALAIRARERGLTVRLVDRARPPIDKACGEGLMPDGVACLGRLGVRLGPEARPFCGIRWIEGDCVAEGRFPASPGLGVRRLHLHEALVERAEGVGVELLWGTRVTGLAGGPGEPRGVETETGEIPAHWIVGADGLRSRVRRWAGLDAPSARRRRFGVRRHFRLAPWTDRVEVYWADGCEAYVTPVGPEEVGVALLWDGGRRAGPIGFEPLLAAFPRLARRLGDAPPTSRDRGWGPLEQRVRGVHRGRLALVGDASGYVDAVTGEGLSLAFHQVFALVEALEAGELGLYAAASRRIRRLPDALTRLLLAVERRPRLRRRLLAALAADGELFSRILAVHSRERPISSLGPRGALRLLGGVVGIHPPPPSPGRQSG
jgi:flavin-dependent dehydrogenase